MIIGVIIAFVIVSTLTGAGLLTSGRTTATTTNETEAYANSTGYTLTDYDADTTKAVSVTQIFADGNQTDGTQEGIENQPTGYTVLVPSTNYSVSSAGVIANATTYVYPNISITYAITTESAEERSSDDLSANFTAGVDNVSSKIPTVLLVAAIVLILGVLAILVGVWQRMRIGESSI